MPETNKVFLTLDIDADFIPQQQEAVDATAVVEAIDAAPASVSYITCGVGDNISVDSILISDLAPDNLDLEGKTITTGDLVVKADTLTVKGTACPIPLPFGYIQLDEDDDLTSDEQALGYSNTPGGIVSNTDDIEWIDTYIAPDGKHFVVKKEGTYECLGVVILEGGASLVDLDVKLNGTAVLTGTPRVHSSIDPLEHTIRAIFTAEADDYINITYEPLANTVKAITGSSMSVKRLK